MFNQNQTRFVAKTLARLHRSLMIRYHVLFVSKGYVIVIRIVGAIGVADVVSLVYVSACVRWTATTCGRRVFGEGIGPRSVQS